MPVLRVFNDPPFVFVDEVLDFIQQTLEGLIFLHRIGIAHRDCSDNNLMLDASSLYPEGFHPEVQHMKRNGVDLLSERVNRTDVLSTIRYYFIDLGISSRFTDPLQPRLVTGRQCQDKEVPELSDTVPYNPFLVDVFILGNVYKTCFTEIYGNLSFLKPLVYEMTKLSPRERYTAEESLELFHGLVRTQRRPSLRWMLLESDISSSQRVSRNVHSIVREIRRLAKKFLGMSDILLRLQKSQRQI